MTVSIHERYDTLIERRLHGELADYERAELAAHLEACPECRSNLESAEQEVDMLDRSTGSVVANCDFDRIRQAIANQATVYRYERLLSRILIGGTLVAAGVFAAILSWQGVVICLWLAGFLFLYYRWRDRRMAAWDAFAQQAKRGDVAAYGKYLRDVRFLWLVYQFCMLISMGVLAYAAIRSALEGRWFIAALTGTAGLAFIVVQGWQVLSPAQREKERAFREGRITSEQYFFGNDACDMTDEPHRASDDEQDGRGGAG